MSCLFGQTVTELEAIVADDGSRDESQAVAEALAAREPRLRVLPGPRVGIAAALNRALAAARADVVVRMDADDTCPPQRLARLLDTLDERPEIGVVGSRIEMVPPEMVGAGMRRYLAWQNALLDHDAMARERFVEAPLMHATCAFRRSVLEAVGGWSEGPVPEDVDLWLRLFAAGVRFAKRPEILYQWHEHAERTTRHDPRFAREALLACKTAHLVTWLDGRAASVWGLGRAAVTWQDALTSAGARVVPGGALDPRALRRPGSPLPWPLDRPRANVAVLPFLSPRVRAELRTRLTAAGEAELETFVFVS